MPANGKKGVYAPFRPYYPYPLFLHPSGADLANGILIGKTGLKPSGGAKEYLGFKEVHHGKQPSHQAKKQKTYPSNYKQETSPCRLVKNVLCYFFIGNFHNISLCKNLFCRSF